MWAKVSFVLSQSTRLTDRQTDGQTDGQKGICNTTTQVNSALHPSGVAESSRGFGWGEGGKVTSAGWQVTLCDLIRHVISRSGVVISITNCYIRLTYLHAVAR